MPSASLQAFVSLACLVLLRETGFFTGEVREHQVKVVLQVEPIQVTPATQTIEIDLRDRGAEPSEGPARGTGPPASVPIPVPAPAPLPPPAEAAQISYKELAADASPYVLSFVAAAFVGAGFHHAWWGAEPTRRGQPRPGPLGSIPRPPALPSTSGAGGGGEYGW